MPTVEELTREELLEQVQFIAEGRSSLRADQKERVVARAILLLAGRDVEQPHVTIRSNG